MRSEKKRKKSTALVQQSRIAQCSERALNANLLLLQRGLRIKLHERLVAGSRIVGEHRLIDCRAEIGVKRRGIAQVGSEATLRLIDHLLVTVRAALEDDQGTQHAGSVLLAWLRVPAEVLKNLTEEVATKGLPLVVVGSV